MRKEIMNKVKRIVVKVGSSSLTNENGLLDIHSIELLVRQISDLHNKGYEMVLVSSGAIAAGMGVLGLKKRPSEIPKLQAAAAVGQVALIDMYKKIFSEYGKTVAQLLLTRDGLEDETRYYHARNASLSLIESSVIQIINENDAVAVDEIAFGDNDTLSAMYAKIVDADLLVILSDIDGLYDENPSVNPDARLIDLVEHIDDSIRSLAGDSLSEVGTGGMITKIAAAEIATSAGINMVIGSSKKSWILREIITGKTEGTLFVGRKEN